MGVRVPWQLWRSADRLEVQLLVSDVDMAGKAKARFASTRLFRFSI